MYPVFGHSVRHPGAIAPLIRPVCECLGVKPVRAMKVNAGGSSFIATGAVRQIVCVRYCGVASPETSI